MANFSVAFTPEAETEVLGAYFWYENQRLGLGEDFKLFLDLKTKSLKKNPKTASYIYKNIRSSKIRRFPYNIIYRIDNSQIQIVAVFHYSRNPKEWRKRI
jgi:plasmid stabilization system protein ParE